MTRHAISRTIARISPLLFLFVFPCMLSAQTFYDDFSDGSAADGSPVTWTPYPETTMGVEDGDLIVSGNLRVSDPVNNFSLSVSGVSLTDPMFSDVSARVQARVLQGTALKLGVRASSSAANADQYLVGIATGGGVALEKIINGVWQVFEIAWDTGLEPSNEDVVLQIDAIGDTLSVWAWRPSDVSAHQSHGEGRP